MLTNVLPAVWLLAMAASATITSTVYTTTWVTTISTLHRHPSDVVVPVSRAAQTLYPFTTTIRPGSSCVDRLYAYPTDDPRYRSAMGTPSATAGSPEPTIITTSTATRTTTATTTLFDRKTPITMPSVVIPTITPSTGLTVTSPTCTNTLIYSYTLLSVTTSTYTKASAYTRATSTMVCMTETTHWSSIAGVSPTPALARQPSWETNSVFTSTTTLALTIWETVTVATSISTTWYCDNPQVHTVQTYFTVTFTPTTTTMYAQRSDCTNAVPIPTAPPLPPAMRRKREAALAQVTKLADPGLVIIQQGEAAPGLEEAIGEIRGSHAEKDADETVKMTSAPSPTPAQATKTITRTALGVSNGTTAAYMWTAWIEEHVMTLTTVTMVGHTVYDTATRVESVCTLPSAGASPGVRRWVS